MRLLLGFLVALLCANFSVLGQSNEVKVTVLSSWGTGATSGYSARIEVKPTGNVTSWEIKINITGTFQYYANHNSTAELVGNVLTLKSKPGLGNIAAGTIVNLDFNGYGFTILPTYNSHTFNTTAGDGIVPFERWTGDAQNRNIHNTNSEHVCIGLTPQEEPRLTTTYYKHTIRGRVNIIGNTNALEIWSPTTNTNGFRQYLTLGIEQFNNNDEYSVLGSNEIKMSGTDAGTVRPKHLLLQTNTANGGGNLGIGAFSSAPIAKLSIAPGVNQKALAVVNSNNQVVFQVLNNGNIWATKINVASQADFPDYVFDKHYRLLSLKEVENYINENKSLPNMPKALEVKQNGMDIAEITRLQQEKIEELTLYLIELNKELNELKSKLNENK